MPTMDDVYDYLIEIGEMSIRDRPRTRHTWKRHNYNCEIMADRLAWYIHQTWHENGFRRIYYTHDSEQNFLVRGKFGHGMRYEAITFVVH